MSGGVAYVLDADGTFANHCNMGMVEIDPLDDRDTESVHALIRRHYDYTQSAVAWRVLSGWNTRTPVFDTEKAAIPTDSSSREGSATTGATDSF
jgi:glutamate synthase domain-containing protein 3